jgi:acetoin utilization deacetylase AcuC-like enzyme
VARAPQRKIASILSLTAGGLHHAKKAEASGFATLTIVFLWRLELLKKTRMKRRTKTQ